MSTPRIFTGFVRVIGVATMAAAMLVGTGSTFAAQEPTPTPPGPPTEMRQKMAAMHERMAVCLRSEKSIDDCRGEMRADCQEMMGAQNCPMMGMGMHDRMMKRDRSGDPGDN